MHKELICKEFLQTTKQKISSLTLKWVYEFKFTEEIPVSINTKMRSFPPWPFMPLQVVAWTLTQSVCHSVTRDGFLRPSL